MYRIETIAITPDLRAALERAIAAAPSRIGIAMRFVCRTALTVLAIAAAVYLLAAVFEQLGSYIFAPRRPCVLTTARGPWVAALPLLVVLAVSCPIALWISQLEWKARQSEAAAARRALASGSVRRITIDVDARHQLIECDEAVLLLQPVEDGSTIVVWLDALERFITAHETIVTGSRWTIDTAPGVDQPLGFAALGPSIDLDFDTMLWIDGEDLPFGDAEVTGIAGKVSVSLDLIMAKAQPIRDGARSKIPAETGSRSRPVPAE